MDDTEFRQKQIAGSKRRPFPTSQLPTLRAAYSDRTATLMAFFAAYSYNEPPQISVPFQAPPEVAELGFETVTYFVSELIDGLVMVSDGPDLAIVSFRGTRSFKNWQTNIDLIPTKVLEELNPGLLVHRGFYEAFDRLRHAGLEARVTAIRTTSSGRKPIYFTGHSLGGALAEIASAVFGGDDIAACYTFGSPRVGNALFDRWIKTPSYRDINYADIVPQIPPPGVYRHSGDPRYLPEHGNQTPFRFEPGLLIRGWQFLQGVWHFVTQGGLLGVEDHSMQLYADRLNAVAAVRHQSR